MQQLGSTPRSQLIAMFDALKEWFAKAGFQGCMFIKASAEYQEGQDPIYKKSVVHKRQILKHIGDLAAKAGAENPNALARRLLILKEGAIVMAYLNLTSNPAMDAKATAKILLADALGH